VRRFRTTAGGVAIGLVLAAASAQAGVAAAADQPPAAQRLLAFASCDELLRYATDHLPRPIPYDPSKPPMPMPTAVAPAMPDSAAGGGDATAGEPDFSDTNVQEAGVDEPDSVKTDGRRIFAIAGGKLVEVDGRAAEPRVLGTLRLEGQGHQLLLWRDRALVIAQAYSAPIGLPAPVSTGAPSPSTAAPTAAPPAVAPARRAPGGPPARAAIAPPLLGSAQTLLTKLDLSLPGRPRIVRSLRIDGSFQAARRADGVVRLVVSSEPRALVDEQARARVAGWVPSYRVRNRRTGRSATRAVSACTQVRRPQEFSGLGLLTVLTLDLARGLTPVDSDSILADVGVVYGSRDALYVASQPRAVSDPTASPDTPVSSEEDASTSIHKFLTREDGQTDYRASGRVAGGLLSQWSLSEQDGVLRAASTVTPPWTPGGATRTSESFVTTLAERDGKLVELGRVGGLGHGERIYAVRFIGDVGYVVTFRQVDPLYTLDLADPRRPQLLGELKIRGYSAYLHPVGEDLLLGVGQAATEQGRRLGGQVSLFDVSDLRRPQRLAVAPLPGWSSQVEWDHHAFLYWPRARLAVIPSEGVGADGSLSGATGFRITRAERLRKVGELRHPATDSYGDSVRRSLVIGGRLFTLSDTGLMSSDLATLGDARWLALDDAG
jgi:hypothetical protein